MRAIEKRLKQLDMSIYQLAKKINESNQTTHYIVRTKDFTKDYLLLKRIAEALDCKIEDILDK